MIYKPVILLLEDGKMIKLKSFASDGEVLGEIVFNTSVIGYQEILTHPSSAKQIINFTCPMIKNYRINHFDYESNKIYMLIFDERFFWKNKFWFKYKKM